MKRSYNPFLLGLSALCIGLSLSAPEAQATPAFARQMEMNCMSCHTQALTTLNSFGRQFKLSGFSMTAGNKSMITGGDLGTSVPLAINAGLGVKSNYVSYSNNSVSRDDLSAPAGSAIMISGKIAEDAGANTLWNGDGLIHMQTTFTQPIGAGRVGFSIFGSQGHGPFISTESYNTGLHKELAIFDNGVNTNAAQATKVGSGPATGLTAFFGGYGLTVTGGMWANGYNSNYSNKGLDVDGTHANLYRITYDLPVMAGWEFSVGAFGLNGSTTGTPNKLFENTPAASTPWNTLLTEYRTKANGFDLQALGSIAGMQSQLAIMHVANSEIEVIDASGKATVVQKNAQKNARQDAKASSVEARVMVWPKFGVSVGGLSYRNDLDTTKNYVTRTVGLLYNYADNVRFTVEQSGIDNNSNNGDHSVTMVQALLAF